MPAFKDLWRSYCARRHVPDADRDFALDLMDRSADVMKERAAAVIESNDHMFGTDDEVEQLAAAIRALTEG